VNSHQEPKVKYIVLLARFLIGGLFIYAAIYKVLDPGTFSVAVRNYMIVPAQYSNLVAVTLPWVELAVGLFLVLGVQVKPSAFLATGMLAVFLGAMIYAYSIGLDIDCGCFGSVTESAGRIGPYHLVRDSILLSVSFLIIVLDKGCFTIARFSAPAGKLRLLNS
jgi:putative oxidoreductase